MNSLVYFVLLDLGLMVSDHRFLGHQVTRRPLLLSLELNSSLKGKQISSGFMDVIIIFVIPFNEIVSSA